VSQGSGIIINGVKMCRLLFVKKEEEEINIKPYLDVFANIAKNAKHDQGDGWGFCYLDENNEWQLHRDVKAMWKCDIEKMNMKTKMMIAHVRDALRLHTINEENNMPFVSGEYAFAFNGRLKGVRMKAEGETGAHKIFNIFLGFIDRNGFEEGVREAIKYIEDHTRYIRALNIIISNKEKTFVYCKYSEEQDFFQIRYGNGIVCSEKFLDLTKKIMRNGELKEIK